MVHIYARLAGVECVGEDIQIAAAFHDLGIWTAGSLDYLPISLDLMRRYLDAEGKPEWRENLSRMVEMHHKLTPLFPGPPSPAETFRRADWIDVSMGTLRWGVPRPFLKDLESRFPYAGFHRRLLNLVLSFGLRHPFNPLPMIKL